MELWPLFSAECLDARLIVDGLANRDVGTCARGSSDICALCGYLRFGQAAKYELQFPLRNRMMTDPASAIKREVHQLVDLRIQTLRQPSSLNTSDLLDYRVRSKKLTVLYQELDQIRRASFKGRLRRAS